MKLKYDICNDCCNNRIIVNKKYNLCKVCNSNRLENNKSNRGNNKEKNSQAEIFTIIWNNSNKKCTLTGRDLSWIIPNTPYWYSCFAHILPKGKYPGLKYDINNIMLVHPETHYQLDFGTHESRVKNLGITAINMWDKKVIELKQKINENRN